MTENDLEDADMASLPDSVEEDGQALLEEEGDMKTPIAQDACGCGKKCHELFTTQRDAHVIAEYRLNLESHSQEQRNKVIFAKVRELHSRSSSSARMTYQFDGRDVCLPFYCWITGTGKMKIQHYKQLIVDGKVEPPEIRTHRAPQDRDRIAQHEADAWFLKVFTSIAEHLAIGDEKDCDYEENLDVDLCPDHPLMQQSMDITEVQPRYIFKISMKEWHELYCADVGETAVSLTAFTKCYKSRWKTVLRMRGHNLHQRCSICAKLSESRKKATSQEEKDDVASQHQRHLEMVMADRNVDKRGDVMSEEYAKKGDPFGASILKLSVDGVDQAKFRIPRNLASSKEFQAIWRPQHHIVGSIAHGWVECYWLMDVDVPKDTNTIITIICKTLDLVYDMAKAKNRSFPRTLLINLDNTSGQNKNQIMEAFESWLVASDKFEATQSEFLWVGHTHGPQDQRFSVLCTLVSRTPTLQDPEELKDTIATKMTTARGRKLHVEILKTTMDFASMLSATNTSVSGLTATSSQPYTNHVWRHVRRDILGGHAGHERWDVDVTNKDFIGIPERHNDSILLLKESMCSTRLSQQPIVAMPADVGLKVDIKSLKPAPRNCFSDRQCKEFCKTADVVEKSPWHLNKASEYLRTLVQNNKEQKEYPKITFKFLEEYTLPERPITKLFVDESNIGYEFAPGSPRRVSLQPLPASAKKKPTKSKMVVPTAGAPDRMHGAEHLDAENKESASEVLPEIRPLVRHRIRGKSAVPVLLPPDVDESGERLPIINKRRKRSRGVGLPPDVTEDGQALGCAKCRFLPHGCGVCRRRKGRSPPSRLRRRGH